MIETIKEMFQSPKIGSVVSNVLTWRQSTKSTLSFKSIPTGTTELLLAGGFQSPKIGSVVSNDKAC